MKSTRAVAADGWRVNEIRDLPDSLLDLGIELVAEIEEEEGKWSRPMLLGMTTCVKKGAISDEELKVDPSEIVAEKGEETRPITNMGPWISAYESVRYDDANRAHEAIMNEDLHGARKECGIYGVSLDLAIQIEEAEEDGDDVVGLSVDKSKFFDKMEYDVHFAILRKLGIP